MTPCDIVTCDTLGIGSGLRVTAFEYEFVILEITRLRQRIENE